MNYKLHITNYRLALIILLVLTISHGLLTMDCLAQGKIIAVINNSVITQKELDDFVNFIRMQWAQEYKGKQLEDKIESSKPELLNKLIEDQIILQEAKKGGIVINPARIKAQIEQTKRRYSSDMEFQAALASQGLTQADVEKKIEEQLLIFSVVDRNVRNRIMIFPSEVTKFYQEHTKDFELPEQYLLDTLAIKDKAMAWEIAVKLKSGSLWQDLIHQYPASVNKLAVSKGEELKKEIAEVVFKLRPGEISGPIKIEDSYYIFILEKIIPVRQQTLSEAQDKVSGILFDRKMQVELTQWLDELKKHSYIKIIQN